jgi:hypothetical protein
METNSEIGGSRVIGKVGEGNSIQLGVGSTALHHIQTSSPIHNVISIQNLSSEGLSAIQFTDDSNVQRGFVGWGNDASSFPSTMIVESDYGIVFSNTEDANSITTGSLRIQGGISIKKNLYLGGSINVEGTAQFTNEVVVPTPSADSHAATKGYVDTNSNFNLDVGDGLTKTGSTLSIATAQPTITSLGILESVTTSGTITITDSTAATASTTGALKVTGGTGIQGSLFVGTDLNVAGATSFNGAVAVPNPTFANHATPKSYVDGATYLTAGTGLTRSGNTFTVDSNQNQITTVGTLNSLNVSGTVTCQQHIQIRDEMYLGSTDEPPSGQGVGISWNVWGTENQGRTEFWNWRGDKEGGWNFINAKEDSWSFVILSNGTTHSASDIRLKKDIETIVDAGTKVDALRGVNFTFKLDNKRSMGFIAQEVEQVLPECIESQSNGYKMVNYPVIVSLLTESIKELRKRVSDLENQLM